MPPRAHATRVGIERLEARDVPAVLVNETFDAVPAGQLPAGWGQWASDNDSSFEVSQPNGTNRALVFARDVAGDAGRVFVGGAVDATVGAAVYLNSVSQTRLIGRGASLGSAAAGYYAAAIARGATGPTVSLVRAAGATEQTLATVSPATGEPYLSSNWAYVTFDLSGSTLRVRVQRLDAGTHDGKFLNSSGRWVADATGGTWALQVTDTAITTGTQVGVGRLPVPYDDGTVGFIDNFRVDVPDAPPPPPPPPATGSSYTQAFESPVGGLPAGWVQSASDGVPFRVAAPGTPQSPATGNALSFVPASGQTSGRSWYTTALPANATVSTDLYLSNTSPAVVLARGADLNTAAPDYYAVEVSRGYLNVQLAKVVNGVRTAVGPVRPSSAYVSNVWARVTLDVSGSTVRAKVQRRDNGQYLNATGVWQAADEWAVTATDTSLAAGGLAGVGQAAAPGGTVTFDNFAAQWPTASPPTVPPPPQPTDPPTQPGPLPATPLPAQTLPHARVMQLAYSAWNTGGSAANPDFNWSLLSQKLVDVAVANYPQHVNKITTASQGHTALLSYANISNLYAGDLLGWLNHADANGLSRERAFFHVSSPFSFDWGGGDSTTPVDRFGSLLTGPNNGGYNPSGGGWARLNTANQAQLPQVGSSLYVGYLDKFRLVNVAVSAAASGWTGAWEYGTTDAGGNVVWKPLPVKSDGSNGLRVNGAVVFDPPADWKAIGLDGRQFYVRLRATANGTTRPTAGFKAEDYLGANGSTRGRFTIPAFDAAADGNRDGYLSDAEFAARGDQAKLARFDYQSRLFMHYGPGRLFTNFADPAVRTWVTDWYSAGLPNGRGLYLDNTLTWSTHQAVKLATVRESAEDGADYDRNLGAALKALDTRLSVRGGWVMPNVSNFYDYFGFKPITDNVRGVYREFLLSPYRNTFTAVTGIRDTLASAAQSNPGLAADVLDTTTTSGSGPGTMEYQKAAVAYYYVVMASPQRSFINISGGDAPSGFPAVDRQWTWNWSDLLKRPIGTPTGPARTWDAGQRDTTSTDPNPMVKYLYTTSTDPNPMVKYLYRTFSSGAMVVFRPLTGNYSAPGGGRVSLSFQLGGSYRELNPDGTLGPVVTSVNLVNGQGMILIPAGPAAQSAMSASPSGTPAAGSRGVSPTALTRLPTTGSPSGARAASVPSGPVEQTSSTAPAAASIAPWRAAWDDGLMAYGFEPSVGGKPGPADAVSSDGDRPAAGLATTAEPAVTTPEVRPVTRATSPATDPLADPTDLVLGGPLVG